MIIPPWWLISIWQIERLLAPMTPQHLLIVDIETVPDAAHHEGDSFPKPPFHTVVAIGFLHAVIDRTGNLGDDEQIYSIVRSHQS